MASDHELVEAAQAELQRVRNTLHKDIQSARQSGLDGLRAAVQSIDAIAQTALATAADNADILATLSVDGETLLTRALAIHDARVATFTRTVAEHSERQVSLAQQAVEYTSDIVAAAERINNVARKSRILALNAAIYTSRLGGQGSSLGVLAREMKEVSDEVARISAIVSGVAKALLDILPKIVDGARDMRAHTESMSHKLDETRSRFTEDALKVDHAVNGAVHTGEQRVNQVVARAAAARQCLQVTELLDRGFDELNAYNDTLQWEISRLLDVNTLAVAC